MDSDLYFKKLVPFWYRGETLQFRVSQLLFSSHRIDSGTRLLLKSLEQISIGSVGRLLDVGCGYGPIGLSLLKAGVAAEAHLVDRDALAVLFSQQNATLNEIESVRVYGGLGYSFDSADAPVGEFDLVVSNIPAKAGDRAIASMLADAGGHLAPGGLAAVVIVDTLGDFASGVLGATDGAQILLDEERAGYRLFHYQFLNGRPAQPDGMDDALEQYLRDEIALDPDLGGYVVQVAHGLPDFEGPGIAAEMAMEALSRGDGIGQGGVAVVFNPGQGYVPLRLVEMARPRHVSLVGADLLALQYSHRNLTGNGCAEDLVSLHHQIGPAPQETEPATLLVALMRGNEDAGESASLAGAFAVCVERGGRIIVAGKSTSVVRLAAALDRRGDYRVVERKKRRGFGLLVAERLG